MKKILIATKNAGKIRELKLLLKETVISVSGLDEFPEIEAPEETGATFAENAVIKAAYYAAQTGLYALADDSGLEVAALGGAPGIYSARYGGVRLTDRERTRLLLDEIDFKAPEMREARFVCAMAIVSPVGETEVLSEGICSGTIAKQPSGENGFGYDPIFLPESYRLTFAELPLAVKQKISHRARAMQKIISFLRNFIVA